MFFSCDGHTLPALAAQVYRQGQGDSLVGSVTGSGEPQRWVRKLTSSRKPCQRQTPLLARYPQLQVCRVGSAQDGPEIKGLLPGSNKRGKKKKKYDNRHRNPAVRFHVVHVHAMHVHGDEIDAAKNRSISEP